MEKSANLSIPVTVKLCGKDISAIGPIYHEEFWGTIHKEILGKKEQEVHTWISSDRVIEIEYKIEFTKKEPVQIIIEQDMDHAIGWSPDKYD